MSSNNNTDRKDHDDDCKVFEEERRILLASISYHLKQVVDGMAEANSNLEQMRQDGQSVRDVANVWKETYERKY